MVCKFISQMKCCLGEIICTHMRNTPSSFRCQREFNFQTRRILSFHYTFEFGILTECRMQITHVMVPFHPSLFLSLDISVIIITHACINACLRIRCRGCHHRLEKRANYTLRILSTRVELAFLRQSHKEFLKSQMLGKFALSSPLF